VAQSTRGLVATQVGVFQAYAALDRDAGPFQMLGKDPLSLGLREEQQKRVPRVGDADVAQRDGDAAAAGVQPNLDCRVAPFNHFAGYAEGREDFEGPRLDGQGARLVYPVELRVDDAEADTVMR
jgi:hypothetical protein